MPDQVPPLGELLTKLVEVGGSDLHLKVGSPPAYRIDGMLHLAELPSLTPSDTENLLGDLIPDRLAASMTHSSELDFAYGQSGLGRFRINSYRQRGSVNIVVRAVTPSSMTFSDLGLPDVVARACDERDGLILVSGPAGSGKTTTCAALIDHINSTRRANIITIEDPIEVLHADKSSVVSQREVGVDTESFAAGMAAVLRQDPDVIYVSELRDAATIESALVAAETGHLVISTMYTVDAVETVHRILDSFPPYLDRRVRQMLASSLRAIVSQRLIPKIDGPGRVSAFEIMINTDAVRECLVDAERTSSLFEVIADGAFYGMQSFDQAIKERYEANEISFSDALSFVTSPRNFKLAAHSVSTPSG